MIADYTLDISSNELAQLNIKATKAPEIGIIWKPREYTYNLGYREAPLWRLTQPPSPDDAWQIDIINRGRRLITGNQHFDLYDKLRTWTDATQAQSALDLISCLPPGQYIIVKSRIKPQQAETIVLGNERLPSPPNATMLIDGDDDYSYIWSLDPLTRASTHHAMIGVAILNYGGDSSIIRTLGVHFFSLRDDQGPNKPHNKNSFFILIVPKVSDLVLDNVWSPDGLKKWSHEGAERFAKRCIG